MDDINVYFDNLTITHTGLQVVETTDYYPYGMVMRKELPSQGIYSRYRHGYQGQFAEKDEETDWSHFKLRQYGSRIGRWTATDPYRQYYSPYVGMGNNPIKRVDPDGGCAVDDAPCIAAAKADRFYIQDGINSYLNADINITESMPAHISLYNSFIAGLYRSESWANSFSGADHSWDGNYGIEFYSTTDLNGNPSYWLRSGKAL